MSQGSWEDATRGLRRTIAVACGMALLAACAGPPAPPPSAAAGSAGPGTPGSGPLRTQTNSYTGRFSVSYADQNGAPRNAYGNFGWQEQDGSVALELRNPFGSTLARLTSTAAGATLEVPDRAPRTATDVDSLMRDELGFSLPVSGLRYWLAARLAPDSPANHIERDQEGRLRSVTQDGWLIDYGSYQDERSTRVALITLTRETAPGTPPLSVKLALNP